MKPPYASVARTVVWGDGEGNLPSHPIIGAKMPNGPLRGFTPRVLALTLKNSA